MDIRDITIQDFDRVNEVMCEVHAHHVQNRTDMQVQRYIFEKEL